MERRLNLTITRSWYPFLKPFPHRVRTNTMPTTIVAATCPLPGGNLAPGDVEALVQDLATYTGQFLPDFSRKDQAPWAHGYLQGLLSDHPRKSIEPIALAHGFPIRSMQAFSGESPWRTEPI